MLQLLHVSMIISDLDKSTYFYGDVLGLELDERPDLNFDGLFYKLGQGQQLHLMCVDNPYQACEHPAHGGRDRHIALAVDDLQEVCQRLERAKIDYTLSKSGRTALFCYDFDGNAVELCELSNTLA